MWPFETDLFHWASCFKIHATCLVIISLYFFIAEGYSIVWIYDCLSIHLWKNIWIVSSFGVIMKKICYKNSWIVIFLC